jgi:hypothetical protein
MGILKGKSKVLYRDCPANALESRLKGRNNFSLLPQNSLGRVFLE